MTLLQNRAIGAAFASLLLLLAAFAFQYIGAMAPCPLCIWQRVPHVLAIALAAVIAYREIPALAGIGCLTMLAGAWLGIYHTGIQRGWWPGPASCSGGGDVAAMDSGALLDQLLATPAVMCDEVAWMFAGLSMPSWQAIAALALAGLWYRAYASSSASQ